MPDVSERLSAGQPAWHRISQLAVLALLLAATIMALVEPREMSPEGIPLAALPSSIGDWQAVDEELEMASDGAYLMLERTYKDPAGQEALLRVQATYTRLGSLRDWSLAATAGGWTPQKEYAWQAAPEAGDVRIQHLQKRSEERIAVTWYTSARSQTASIKKAQVLAWRERLIGDRRAWASMYLLVPAGSEGDAEAASQEIAAAVAPRLREMMAASRPAV